MTRALVTELKRLEREEREQTAQEAAEAWLRDKYPHFSNCYGVGRDAFLAGRSAGLELAAEICNEHAAKHDKLAAEEAESGNDIASDFHFDSSTECLRCAAAIRAASEGK